MKMVRNKVRFFTSLEFEQSPKSEAELVVEDKIMQMACNPIMRAVYFPVYSPLGNHLEGVMAWEFNRRRLEEWYE